MESYNFEESCLIKKQISEHLLNGISEGKIELEDTVVEKLERIQSGSYSAMPIDRILELGKSHGIKIQSEENSFSILRKRLIASQENKIIIKEKELEASKEFAKENEGKKLHVFLVKKSIMEIDGWGCELSDRIEHFIYIANDSKIELKKELEESTEWERDTRDGLLKLKKEGNSFTFTLENIDDPWEVYTYTLVNQIELDISVLVELFWGRNVLGLIKSLISGTTRIIELDIEDSQKNVLFFDPSKLAMELSINIKDLSNHQFNILVEEIKKVLGFFPTK